MVKQINRIILLESLYRLIAVLVTSGIWCFVTFYGIDLINKNFKDNTFYSIITIVWMMCMLLFTKIITNPVFVFEDKDIKESK